MRKKYSALIVLVSLVFTMLLFKTEAKEVLKKPVTNYEMCIESAPIVDIEVINTFEFNGYPGDVGVPEIPEEISIKRPIKDLGYTYYITNINKKITGLSNKQKIKRGVVSRKFLFADTPDLNINI
jgi:hypothetical protein